jgi:hypothetical protein
MVGSWVCLSSGDVAFGHFRLIYPALAAGPCPLRLESARLASRWSSSSFMSIRPNWLNGKPDAILASGGGDDIVGDQTI